jgi:hypothetical protein
MTDPSLEQVIVERARARSQALIHGDVPALTQILAEDFIYTNASGHVLDRPAYLQTYVTSGAGRFLAQTMSAIRVQVYGEAAVLSCQVHDQIEYQGQRFESDYRSTFVYVRQAGQWRCVAGQTTAITPE